MALLLNTICTMVLFVLVAVMTDSGWVIPTHVTVFGHDDPIWILGVYYHGKNSGRPRVFCHIVSSKPVSRTARLLLFLCQVGGHFLIEIDSIFWRFFLENSGN